MSTTVFVSSPYYDLIDTRAELEAHLRSLGLSPVMSDRLSSDFVGGARGDSIETCLVELRKCDIVLVVLSQRYGPPLPDPYRGLSATHVEFQEATRLEKPTRFYVRDRLLADFNTWRRDPNANLLWVNKEKDKGILELVSERESTLRTGQIGPDVPSNWIWPFRDSVELKERITKDLEQESRQSLLRSLIREGTVPTLTIERAALGSGTIFVFTIVNAGPTSAFNIKYRWEAQNEDEWQKADSLPPHAQSQQLRIEQQPFPGQSNAYVLGRLLIRYEAPAGYTVQDRRTFAKYTSSPFEFESTLESRQLIDRDPYRII